MLTDTADHLIRIGTLATGAASGAAAGIASSWSMMIFGVPLAVVFAAFAGALVSLSFLPAASLSRTLVILGSGSAAGAYTSALVAEWWGFSPAATGGAAFIVGGALQWAVPAVIRRIQGPQ
jgi:hypothetical protein